MEFSKNFLIQTAKDYGFDLEKVKKIAKKASDSFAFYSLLEDEIKIRNRK